MIIIDNSYNYYTYLFNTVQSSNSTLNDIKYYIWESKDKNES